ncbi:hypothetical protein D9M73_102200 [compost metagenome]
MLFQRHLQIGFVEEFRVGQARRQHLAVALDDLRAAIGRIDIGGADEGIRQIPLPLAGGVRGGQAFSRWGYSQFGPSPSPSRKREGSTAHEILLVHARGELDHFGGHAEERFVEAAEQRHWPFGETGIFGQQALVLHQLEPRLACRHRRAERDDLAAFGLVDDDMAGAQFLDIIVGRADRDDAGMVEAMADGSRACLHADNLDRHHRIAEQRNDALQRAHPAQRFHRGRTGTPAHRLGPREGADDRRDRLGQHRRGRTARLIDHREQHAIALDQLLAREAGLAQEPFKRLRRGGGLGALGLFRDRRCFDRQAARDQRQAARGGVGDDLAGGKAALGDLSGEQLGEILARTILHPRRNFLGAQLKQKVGHARTSRSQAQPLCAFVSLCEKKSLIAQRREDTKRAISASSAPLRAKRRLVRAEARRTRRRRRAVLPAALLMRPTPGSALPIWRCCARSTRRTRPSPDRGRGPYRPGAPPPR